MKCLITILSLLFAISAHAEMTVTGTQIEIRYTEPTMNAPHCQHPRNDIRNITDQAECESKGGTWVTDYALKDLSHTNYYIDVGDGQGYVKSNDVPASDPKGGGAQVITDTIPFWNLEMTVSAYYTATDTSNNESVASVADSIQIDILGPVSPLP